MDETWLTTEQLLNLAAEAGFPDITPRQLKRWRYERVLLSPKPCHLGRGKGTRSLYPPETGPQLLALCRLRQRLPHDMEAVRFLLWLQGYSIQMEDLKYSLRQLLAPFSQLLPPDITDPLAAAEQAAEKALPNLRRSKWGRKAKRALGTEADVASVFTAALQLLQGDTPIFHTDFLEQEHNERSLAELWALVTGLDRAQVDHLNEQGPWLTGNLADELTHLAQQQLLALPVLLQTLEEVSPEQLIRARNDLSRLLIFREAARATETLLTPNAFGWGTFRTLPTDPPFLAWFLLCLVRFRAIGYGPQLTDVGQHLKKMRPLFQTQLAFVKTLWKELPTVAYAAFGEQEESPLTPEWFEHRLEQLRAVYSIHQAELDAFFQRHPEFRSPEHD